MKKIISTLIGALALFAMVIQPTSLTTTQIASATSTLCIENPTSPECINIPMCMPNQGQACSSMPNVCGESTQWTYDCMGSCSAIMPPMPADTNENGTPDCMEEENECVEWAWDPCVSEENVCGNTSEGTIDCNGSCTAIVPTPEDENENGTPDCMEIPYVDGQITKTANLSITTIWSPITYTLSYSNIGNSSTTNGITISDTLPAGTSVISASQEYEQEGNTIYFYFEWLGAGQTWFITITVSTAETVAGVITNTATIDMSCYIETRDTYVKSISNLLSLPIIVKVRNLCDENSQNNTSSVNVTMRQQWGWFWWGAGSPPPPVLLDTWWPSTWSTNTGTVDTWDALTFAQQNDISTVDSEDARLTDKIIRGEVAKILSTFYKNVLKKTITHIDECNPSNYSDYATTDEETRWYIYDVCSVGLMGWKNDKKSILDAFRPSAFITKAEFATVLSRMLYNTVSDNNGETWFEPHFAALIANGIISEAGNANDYEIRGNVFDMLLKAGNIMK